MITISESNQGQTIKAKPGDTLGICLEENPTAGFRWRLDSAAEAICTLRRDAFEPGHAAVGQAGVHRWWFNVITEGRATITLSYGRGWERPKSASRTFILHLDSRK